MPFLSERANGRTNERAGQNQNWRESIADTADCRADGVFSLVPAVSRHDVWFGVLFCDGGGGLRKMRRMRRMLTAGVFSLRTCLISEGTYLLERRRGDK